MYIKVHNLPLWIQHPKHRLCVKKPYLISLGYVWKLGFGGEERGMKGFGRGKLLFGSFKK
jgi:hypothetical protein